MSRIINEIDTELSELIEKVFEEEILQTKKIKELVKYTENLLGGRRNKEWILRSELDL